LREQRGQVVGSGERVGGDVDAQRGEGEGKCCEEAGGARGPVGDERHGVPVEFAILRGTGGGGGHADEGDEGEDEGEEGDVEDLPFDADAGVAGEVGLVMLALPRITLLNSLFWNGKNRGI
jgi:hypothetical protein